MDVKKVGIFGAGQAGLMVKRWLSGNLKPVCFIDNHEKKQGTRLDGTIVCSLEQALIYEPDCIWIAILNREAAKKVESQIKKSKFEGTILSVSDFKMWQDIRLASLRLAIDEIKKRNIPGEMAELGVFQGDLAIEMNALLPDRKLYLFDTFTGFDAKDIETERILGNKKAAETDFSDTSIEHVRNRLQYPEQAVFCVGHFPESLEQAGELPPLAFVSLDPDLYAPVYHGLKTFYPRLNPGGMILIHDYNSMQFPGVKKAVERYCEEENLFLVPLMDLHGSAILIRQG